MHEEGGDGEGIAKIAFLPSGSVLHSFSAFSTISSYVLDKLSQRLLPRLSYLQRWSTGALSQCNMARPQSQPEKRSLLARATIEREQEQEPEITSCVASIIRAFTQSFDIFRRLRERRRRRRKSKKSRGKDGKEDGASAAELRLSQSLRRGPQHIGGVYEKGIKEKGREFEKGDGEFPF